MPYSVLLAAHIAAVLAWIAGMVTLSIALTNLGLSSQPLEPQARMWLLSIRRWERRVTCPAMFLALLLGVAVAAHGSWFDSPWLWAKLFLVFLLAAIHAIHVGLLKRRLQGSTRPLSGPKLLSAVVTVLLASAVVVLATLKPF